MGAVLANDLRFKVDPRDLPPQKAARRLGLTFAVFKATLPRLRGRGFPDPDPDTGNFDAKAIEAWMDSRSPLTGGVIARDPGREMRERIARMRGG